jgi:hypothetical protein
MARPRPLCENNPHLPLRFDFGFKFSRVTPGKRPALLRGPLFAPSKSLGKDAASIRLVLKFLLWGVDACPSFGYYEASKGQQSFRTFPLASLERLR